MAEQGRFQSRVTCPLLCDDLEKEEEVVEEDEDEDEEEWQEGFTIKYNTIPHHTTSHNLEHFKHHHLPGFALFSVTVDPV